MSKHEENNSKHVEIIRTNISGDKCSVEKSFVLPGHTRINKGETIKFHAIETGAKLIFPNVELFGTKELIIESGGSAELTVSKYINEGVYSYAVITTANNDLASGGSFPRFIVE